MTQPETEPWTDGAPAGDVALTGAIGKYQVQRVLGTGGEGIVLAAYDPELGRSVAIKFRVRDSEEGQQRLIREAQAMAQLHHPNVVTVFEVLRLDHRTGIVMALIDGSDLRKWRETPRSWREVVAVYLQAARGLAAAHRAGLVHRDFKPSNAMIDADGVVRVSDFGLARTTGGDAPAGSGELATGSELTRTGAVVGTPAYVAPEQRTGGRVDARADQYSFAVALYEALAEKRPEPSRPEPPPGPRWLRRVVLCALADDPEARFPSMAEVVRALEAGLARRRWVIAAVAAVAIAGAVVAVIAVREPSPAAPTEGSSASSAWTPVTIGNEPGDSAIREIAVSRDGAVMAYASETDVVVERRSGGARSRLPLTRLGSPESVKLSRAGDSVLVAVRRPDRVVEIWEAAAISGTWERRHLPESTSISSQWDVGPDGSLLIVERGQDGHGGRLLRVERAGGEHVIAEGTEYLHPSFSFDGTRVAVATNLQDHIEIIDLATGKVDPVTVVRCIALDWVGRDSLGCVTNEERRRVVELALRGDRRIERYTSPQYVNIWQFRGTEAGVLLVEESIEVHLHVVDLAGGERRRLATGSVSDAAPAGWTPSGSLVFGADLRGRLQMLAMRPDEAIDVVEIASVAEAPLAVLGDAVIFGRFPGNDTTIPLINNSVGRFFDDGQLFRLDANNQVTALGPTHGLVALRCAGDRAPPCVLIERVQHDAMTAVVWDPATGARGRELSRWELRAEGFHALSPDGRRFVHVVGLAGHEIAVVDVSDGRTQRFDVPGYAVRFLAWTPDGRLVGTCRDIATDRWSVLELAPGHAVPIMTAARGEFLAEPRISADGKRLAIGIADQRRRQLWFPSARIAP